jgi:hypothetical protein
VRIVQRPDAEESPALRTGLAPEGSGLLIGVTPLPNAGHQRRAKRVRCMPLLGCNRSFLFNCGLNIV